MTLAISFTPLAQWLALIMGGLQRAAATCAGRDHAIAPLVNLLLARIRRLTNRFNALIARLAAGQPAAPYRPRTRPARAAPPAEILRLPRDYFWLIRLLPYEAAGYGSQLQAMLADPQTAALLAAAPEAGRILRPLCRLLAIHPEGALALPSAAGKPPPRNRPAKPAAAPPAAPQSAIAQLCAVFAAQIPGAITVTTNFGSPPHKPPWWPRER
jgi:hypothetical protein